MGLTTSSDLGQPTAELRYVYPSEKEEKATRTSPPHGGSQAQQIVYNSTNVSQNNDFSRGKKDMVKDISG